MTQALPVGLTGGRDPLCPAPRPGTFSHDRWQVLQLVKDTARALGIGEREIAVLAAHLSVLPKGPVRADGLLVSFAQVTGILERANCMDERRFRRGETRLAVVGLVARKLSGNARRYPVRDGQGRIVDAYGIDLRPLFLRVPELETLRETLREEAARRRALRSRISARIGALRRQVTGITAELAARLDDLQRLCRRTGATLADLAAADAQIAAMEAPDASQPDRQPADAGQIVRRKESQEKEINTPDTFAEVQKVWRSSGSVRVYYPESPGDLHGIASCIGDLLRFIGFDRTACCNLIRSIPLPDLLRILDYVLGKVSDLQNPAGYLRSMIARYQSGEVVAGGRVSLRGIYDRGHNQCRETGLARL